MSATARIAPGPQYRQSLAANNSPADPRELTAWSALVRTLLTRNEFLFVD